MKRNQVLWIGRAVPAELEKQCKGRWLRIASIVPSKLDHLAPSAKALVIECTDAITCDELLIHYISMAFNHGLLVLLAQPEDMAAEIYYSLVKPLAQEAERVVCVYNRWVETAERAARHNPGPPENPAVKIEGLSWQGIEPQILFRRAFHDLDRVQLQTIHGGRSGAALWIAYPTGAGAQRRPLPYLVKLHSREKIREERLSYSYQIRDAVPFSHRPNIDEERSVEGSSLALLVQDFVERAIPLREALPRSVPGQLVSSLFDGALRGCLANTTDRHGPIVQAFEPLKVLKWETLVDVAERANACHRTGISPSELRRQVEQLPPIDYRIGVVHGDLHLDNIYVASGTSHVILIDFGRVTRAPVVADYSCLDVSVGFTGDPDLDDTTMRRLYMPPLAPVELPPPYDQCVWVCEALRAIRHAVLLSDPEPAPFIFGVASYLLRFASYPDNGPLDRRSLAFDLAAKLFGWLKAHA